MVKQIILVERGGQAGSTSGRDGHRQRWEKSRWVVTRASSFGQLQLWGHSVHGQGNSTLLALSASPATNSQHHTHISIQHSILAKKYRNAQMRNQALAPRFKQKRKSCEKKQKVYRNVQTAVIITASEASHCSFGRECTSVHCASHPLQLRSIILL